MPKLLKAERQYEAQLAQLFRESGWLVSSPQVPVGIDLFIQKDNLQYAVELKRAAESRRDRIVPLLAEAILQAQAYSRNLPHARPLAVVASPHLSHPVIDQALEFRKAYADDVAVGLFDDHGFRVFRGPGLEGLDSPSRDLEHQKSFLPKLQSYPIFSDLGQWMLKVILAQHLDPKFLRAARQNLHNASALALAAGVSPISASRLLRQLEAEGFLDSYAGNLRLVRIHDLLEEWQAASRRAYKGIPCRWINGHSEKQLQSALRSYAAGPLSRVQPGILGSGRPLRVCLGLFAQAFGLGFVHGVPPVIYIESLDAELLQCLGISSQKAERADVHLRIPVHKESIFRAAVDQGGVPICDALQVWLDVSNHPSGRKEQANLLRERILDPLLNA